MSKLYDSAFFEHVSSNARSSATQLVPIVTELISPTSVVDVGCGTGTWLAAFRSAGVQDIAGFDGVWVDVEKLEIPRECFTAIDLSQSMSISRRFDLAVSLEVAEHLPPESAAVFVDSLTALSDVVLFSAAIPYQGGTDHLNERWPDYWAAFFHQRGYITIDCLRAQLWNNPEVSWWYSQNALLFVKADVLPNHPRLAAAAARYGTTVPLSLVHPDRYAKMAVHLATVSADRFSTLSTARQFGRNLLRAVQRRVGSLRPKLNRT